MRCDCCGQEIEPGTDHTCTYDRWLDLGICPDCGEYIIDGYCGCSDDEDFNITSGPTISAEERERLEAEGMAMLEEMVRLERLGKLPPQNIWRK